MGKRKKIIQNYFEVLYKKEEIDEENIKQYLKVNGLPELKEEQREILNKEITATELRRAVQKQKSNKTPGPDGLPGEVYKSLYEDFEMILLEVYNDILEKAKLPDFWIEAYISLILKEGTNPKQIKNYRPISLLNTDYKIFTTIIAERLKLILNEIIHSDQNGFLPKRQIRNNMC